MKTQLIERWEARAVKADEFAVISEAAGSRSSVERCKCMAISFRLHISELEKEIQMYDWRKIDVFYPCQPDETM